MVSKITRKRISGTTDSSGDSTDYSTNFTGMIKKISLDIDGLASTADITITSDGELVAESIYSSTDSNTNVILYPRTPSQDNAGNDVTFDNTNELYEPFCVSGRIKIVVAQGGDTKSYVADILIEEY